VLSEMDLWRNGAIYCVDAKTGKRTSLGKHNEDEARQIINAKSQALRQRMPNMQIAKAYLFVVALFPTS